MRIVGRRLQIARPGVQLLGLLALVAIPALAHSDTPRAQRDAGGIAGRWDTALIHRVLADAEHPERITNALRGSTWTLRQGEFVISDPLAVLDFAAASRVPLDVVLLSAPLPLLATLLLGRVFCGWICPADLLFELGSVVRRWARIETDLPFARGLKYALLAVGAAAALALGTQVFAEIYPPRLVGAELYLLVTVRPSEGGAGASVMLNFSREWNASRGLSKQAIRKNQKFAKKCIDPLAEIFARSISRLERGMVPRYAPRLQPSLD